MPRKTLIGLEHVKTVKRGKDSYLYFNTGQKVDGKAVYVPLGKKGSPEVGTRYSAALNARSRRNGMPTALTLPQFVMRYQRAPEFTKRSVGTQKTYGVYLNRLAREFDTASAGSVETSDILELMDEIGRPAAVDMLLLAGNQMYRWGLKRKYVAHNPFEGIDREDWEARQYEPWPEDVLEAALADPKLWLATALLYYTAQRIGDCCKAEWLDLEQPRAEPGEIYVKQQKTGKELWIPIHKDLAAALERVPRSGATILTGPDGKKAKGGTLRWQIKEFGKARGIDLVPHGLRKNAVNALLEAGCSTAETASISGQSLRMVEHYARQRNSRRMGRKAMGKWEQFGNRETLGKTSQEMAE